MFALMLRTRRPKGQFGLSEIRWLQKSLLLELEPPSRELRRLAESITHLLREDRTFAVRTAMT